METITNEQVLTRLVESEAGRAAKAAIEHDYTAERTSLKAQAETLRKERGALARQHADEVEATRQRLENARKVMTEAEGEHHRAVMVQKQQRAHFDARIKALENKQRAMAPASINQFIDWLGDLESDCKGTPILENAQVTNKVSTHTSQAIRQYTSNAASLRDRLAAIKTARSEAEKLKDKVLDAADIEQRLDELREGLPAVAMAFAYEK